MPDNFMAFTVTQGCDFLSSQDEWNTQSDKKGQ